VVNGNERLLSIKSGALKFNERWIRLISLQNIKSEIEAGELDAWRKLLRIQRHEIINSLTPITTLTTAIRRRFISGTRRKALSELTDEQINDTLNSVEVIEERSKGLVDFIERFKGITDLPGIKAGTVSIKAIFNTVGTLFAKELNEKDIELNTQIIPEGLTAQGDAKLLEQVLINLVKNSIEAIENRSGRIALASYHNSGNLTIQVTDNGKGIEKSALESIFVPSYTTKENGSGIGLSISRQIVQLHRGTMEVKSIPEKETTFAIILPE
jgi:signal transduction histidine kinase